MSLKAMILAAGVGSRLRPYTDTRPKPMMLLAGKPLLARTIEGLARQQVRDIVINLFHCPDVVQEYFGDGAAFGARIRYSPESWLRGTAGALAPWKQFFERSFLVVYGDNLIACDVTRLMRFHAERGAACTIALVDREDVSQSGVVSLDQNDRVRWFVEKPPAGTETSHFVNGGLLVVEPRLLADVPDDRPCDFGRDLLPAWCTRGEPLYGYRMGPGEKIWWIDTPTDLERVQSEMLAGREV